MRSGRRLAAALRRSAARLLPRPSAGDTAAAACPIVVAAADTDGHLQPSLETAAIRGSDVLLRRLPRL
jgi:hypothetical protein